MAIIFHNEAALAIMGGGSVWFAKDAKISWGRLQGGANYTSMEYVT